jgi:3-oxoacyl-[acyl-carrier protein] reductase
MAVDLTGKVCLVTGADEGVGRGLVQGFASRGATVFAGLLRPNDYREHSPSVIPVGMDVTVEEQVTIAIEYIGTCSHRIDVLINNAGIYPRHNFESMCDADWNRVLEINFLGAWRTSRACLSLLKESGAASIVNVGSIALRLGMGDLVHYLSSKGAVVGFTRGMARDLGQFGIRVNCIHLGSVRTEGELRLYPDQVAVLQDVETKQALRGRLTPESVEPVFAFLASDESGDITGQCLTVDRGWTHD